MTTALRWLHPRRAWLWASKKDDILAEAALLTPRPYRIETLLRDYRVDFDDLKRAGLIGSHVRSEMSNAVEASMKKQRRLDATLGALEGAAIYGSGLLDQLRHTDTHFVQALTGAVHKALINSANLNVAMGAVGQIAHAAVAPQYAPFVGPIINTCLNHAEQWCNDHLLNSAGQVIQAADVAQLPAGLLAGGAWLDPANSVTSHPLAVIADHLNHVDSASTLGESLAHGAADAGLSHAADHAADVVGHVPWFSLIRSGHREYSLLRAGKTDALSSAKNVGIDTGSMAVGAKAGAAIGSVFFPVVGTAIGGGIGGILGKLVGNHMKQGELRKVKAAYDAEISKLSAAQKEVDATVTSEFNRAKNQYQLELKQTADRAASEITRSSNAYATWRDRIGTMSSQEGQALLEKAEDGLESVMASLQAKLVSEGIARRWLWQNVMSEAMTVALDELAKRKQVLRRIRMGLTTNESISTSVLFEHLAKAGISEDDVRKHLRKQTDEAEKNLQGLKDQVQQSQTAILLRRRDAVTKLDALLKALTGKAKERLEPIAKQLEATGSKYLREQEKLGLA